jgi:hypothetical protein
VSGKSKILLMVCEWVFSIFGKGSNGFNKNFVCLELKPKTPKTGES